MKNLNHIAIIMDGNRRWAQQRNLPPSAGHKEGAKALTRVIQHCVNRKIDELTVFAFSTENWSREPEEVREILKLIETYIRSKIAIINSNNIKLKFIGDRSKFSKRLVKLMDTSEILTSHNNGLNLNVGLNYGGKQDIVFATKNILLKINSGLLNIEDINDDIFRLNLPSSEISDVDLLIRSSGENRLSNFMLWQNAYSELYFTEKLWPDFYELDLDEAVNHFSFRNRRFGSSEKSATNSYK